MGRQRKGRQWLAEFHSDSYVKRAREEGYRSRAAYKLLEINEKDRLLRPGMSVVDLGAAPGGWSQVAAEIAGSRGRVIALDILPMSPLKGVDFIQGDFREQDVYESLLRTLEGHAVDLVISDMAPNISGVKAVDQPKSIYLVELAVELAETVTREGGSLVVKVFQGAGFQELMRTLRLKYNKVVVRKPRASRARSKETYLVGLGFRG